MRNRFFVSDTHFFHRTIIKYCKRPFKDPEEMTEKMVEEWNKHVTPADLVYHLGDFSFGNLKQTQEVLNRLNGQKVLIRGNHDAKAVCRSKGWMEICDLKTIVLDKKIVMCHYPMRSWWHAEKGTVMLFGHVHGTLSCNDQSMDVGVDYTRIYRPLSWEEVKEELAQLPPRKKAGIH